MSTLGPGGLRVHLEDDDNRAALVVAAVLAAGLATAALSADASVRAAAALLLLVGGPLLGLRFPGRLTIAVLIGLAAASGFVFRSVDPTAEHVLPVLILQRVAYFSVPPLLATLVLGTAGRDRLGLGPLHVWAPAAAMVLGSLVHMALRWGQAQREQELRGAAVFCALAYLALIAVGLLQRVRSREEAPPPATGLAVDRGLTLEEEGRFGAAALVYEREGKLDEAAQAARRAGDWARAARIFQRQGKPFDAGEMYYQASMWPESLACYEEAKAWAAAARLHQRLGDTAGAVRCFELASDGPGVVRVLEAAGLDPTGDQYRKAGRLDRAAEAFERAGEWVRAADVYAQELRDPLRAARLHLDHGSPLVAGRLFEAAGRGDDAIRAFSATPEGALEATRVLMRAGRAREAAELLAGLPPAQLETIDDEPTLTVVARVLLEAGRTDDAVRLLQGLKRRGQAGGGVHLLLGQALMARALPDLAEEELRTATSLPLDPVDEMNAAYLLGCVLETSGKSQEAVGIFHQLLQKDLMFKDVQERYRRLKSAAAGPAAGGSGS